MVFLKNKDEEPDKWKDKYFRLLESQEQTESAYQANEDLLCKTIVRFALAVKGFNRELDPHLIQIRNALKNGLKSVQLQKELEAFSNALLQLGEEQSTRQFDSFLLFEFLYRQYPQYKLQLELIQEKYDQREFKNTQGLMVALLELVDEKSSGSVYFGIELPDAEHQAIRAQLLRWLDYADIPEKFAGKLDHIKARIQTESEIKALVSIFDDTVSLFLEVKKHQVVEQLEMTDFLAKLTDELADLALKATGVDRATEHAMQSRQQFDEKVTLQMADLKHKSANATQLETLKSLVNSHLTSISQQILAHNKQERLERESFQLGLRNMTQKIKEMETESTDLKQKLEIAQQTATRDALTGLPNRLALEQRLDEEIARSLRYANPFCLLIWDIDFFKKINDSYGHKTGDKALMAIAQLLQEHSRKSDFVARFGGEEFVMIFPETDAETSLLVANKLRETVEKASFRVSGDKIVITVSCGIGQYIVGDSSEVLFERADKALYQAKLNGRNQCIIFNS